MHKYIYMCITKELLHGLQQKDFPVSSSWQVTGVLVTGASSVYIRASQTGKEVGL